MSKGQGQKIAIKFSEALLGDVTGLTPIPVGYKAGNVDLAQGKTVAVGNATYGAGASAVDGNNATYWGTYSTLPWWIVIDLTEVKKSAGFYILQSNASYRAKAYNIQGSNDNASWSNIDYGELVNIAEQIIEYPVSDYRYMKLNFTSYWSSSRAYIYTLKILEASAIGNEIAFKLTGQQYKYINGPLLDMDYMIDKVEQHPTEPKTLLLTTYLNTRFPTVEGMLKLEYDASIGNLSGNGGAVESFIETFTPTDLAPEHNPGIEETITVAPTELEVNFIPIGYMGRFTENTLTVAPAELEVNLIFIDEENP